jgi:hypothetical protein
MASPSFGGPTTPSPVPSAASVILTYGTSSDFQSLTEVGGYGGAIAFPKAPEPTAPPSPKGKGTPAPAPTPVAIAIGVTLTVSKPEDGPDLNFESGKGRKKKTRELPARALAYVVLLPTHDATLASYPRITLDVPRTIASQYRDGEFGLALWNSGEKDSKYRLAVAELDIIGTPPPVAVRAPVANPLASAHAGATGAPSPGVSNTPRSIAMNGASLPPGSSPGPIGTATPTAAPTLPPERLLFAATAITLKLVANRPAVFALYALPHPSTPPAAKTSGSPASLTRTSGGSASSAPTTIQSSSAPATSAPAPAKSP